jgi:hypothetical protein
VFRKVAECLYRYSSNGVYYARFKTDGKEIRRSLETTDPIGVSVPRFRGYFPLWRLTVPALHASASCLAPPLLSVVCL